MSELVLVSHVLLWAGFLVLLVIVLALLRQVGVLFERVAPAGALAVGSSLAAGDAAPVRRLVALSGGTVELGSPRSDGLPTLLLFVAPSCPVCEHLLPIAKAMARERVRVIYASAGEDVQAHEKFVATHGLPRGAYVVSNELGMAFGAAKLPFAALIGAGGRVPALGLVNTREHLESLFEAARTGVVSVQDFMARRLFDAAPVEVPDPPDREEAPQMDGGMKAAVVGGDAGVGR